MYAKYNDYELLYLISEGNENALNYLFKKYDHLIRKMVFAARVPSSKREDLIQECRMLLFDCTKSYKPELQVTFYSYVLVCLRRLIRRLSHENYYVGLVLTDYTYDKGKGMEPQSNKEPTLDILCRRLFESELEQKIYDEILIAHMSLNAFSKKFNISYYKVYATYKRMVERLKCVLTNMRK